LSRQSRPPLSEGRLCCGQRQLRAAYVAFFWVETVVPGTVAVTDTDPAATETARVVVATVAFAPGATPVTVFEPKSDVVATSMVDVLSFLTTVVSTTLPLTQRAEARSAKSAR
jgi:hypothetical protein